MKILLSKMKNRDIVVFLFFIMFSIQTTKSQTVMPLDGLYISYNIDAFNTITPDIQMFYINEALDSCRLLGFKSELIGLFSVKLVDSTRVVSTDDQMYFDWRDPYMYLSFGDMYGEEVREISLTYLKLSKPSFSWKEINPLLHPHLEVIHGYYFYKYPLAYSNSYALLPVINIEDKTIYYHLNVGRIQTLVFELE